MSSLGRIGLLSRERVRACATGRNTEGSQVWGLTQRVSQSQMLSCLSQPHEKVEQGQLDSSSSRPWQVKLTLDKGPEDRR